jgi:hypothetical protein
MVKLLNDKTKFHIKDRRENENDQFYFCSRLRMKSFKVQVTSFLLSLFVISACSLDASSLCHWTYKDLHDFNTIGLKYGPDQWDDWIVNFLDKALHLGIKLGEFNIYKHELDKRSWIDRFNILEKKLSNETETEIVLSTYNQIEGVFENQAKALVKLDYYDYWLATGFYSGDDEEKIYTDDNEMMSNIQSELGNTMDVLTRNKSKFECQPLVKFEAYVTRQKEYNKNMIEMAVETFNFMATLPEFYQNVTALTEKLSELKTTVNNRLALETLKLNDLKAIFTGKRS